MTKEKRTPIRLVIISEPPIVIRIKVSTPEPGTVIKSQQSKLGQARTTQLVYQMSQMNKEIGNFFMSASISYDQND